MNRVKISWTCSSVQQARPLRRVREFKSEHEQTPWNQLATVCPRSSDPFIYSRLLNIKWVTTSWTRSTSIKYIVVAGVFTLKGLGHYSMVMG